jgi:hypothetical protein
MSTLQQREAFRTSRALDFATERGLTTEIGHGRDHWPAVVLKELVDNAMDAVEEVGEAPVIEVRADETMIEVRDNGPGLPDDVIADVLDFTKRVSSREAYAGPTRGAQGNALKTVVAMPFVLDGGRGMVEIEAHGVHHQIAFAIDRIAQEPRVEHRREPSLVKTGSIVRLLWPDSASSLLAASLQKLRWLAYRYVVFNPHLTLSVAIGDFSRTWNATDPGWRKWTPGSATPIHWYTAERLVRLVQATIHADRTRHGSSRPAREFLAQFAGMSGSTKQKKILDALELQRATLDEAFVVDGEVSRSRIDRAQHLLAEITKPPKVESLGLIGEAHLRERLACPDPDQVVYRKVLSENPADPRIAEMLFAYIPRGKGLVTHAGLNFSPALYGTGAFRLLPCKGYGGLDGLLGQQNVSQTDPLLFVIHHTGARLAYIDRGKSTIDATGAYPFYTVVTDRIEKITDPWRRQKEAEVRGAQAAERRAQALNRAAEKEGKISIKEAAYRVMEAAYLAASGGERKLPTQPRQVMYQARRDIVAMTGEALPDKYFTQVLLPDFCEDYPDLTASWNIVWDPRGNLNEPHTGRVVPLGTQKVRSYIAARSDTCLPPRWQTSATLWPTHGPEFRYGAILFIEKEGFAPLFKAVRLAERWDIAIMSTKGVSTTAARELVDHIISQGVPVFVIRDFDDAGFKIAGTLRRDTRRYKFETEGAIDLGLRLEDAQAWGLESEHVYYKGERQQTLTDLAAIRRKIAPGLQKNGATEAEIEFLLTHRIELNAFPSDRLIAWIESKLEAAGVRKVVPDDDMLARAARDYARQMFEDRMLEEAREEIAEQAEEIEIDGCREAIEEMLAEDRGLAWDEALRLFLKEKLDS